MRFPDYREYGRPARPLMDAYAAAYGYAESVENVGHPPQAASVALGKACLDVAQGNHKRARRRLSNTKRVIKQTPVDKDRQLRPFRNVAFVHDVTSLLEFRNQPIATDKIRSGIHNTAIKNIRSQLYLPARGESAESRKGVLNELTALGLFTRYNHPWMLALPALHFQDRGSTATNNFDLLLAESLPDQQSGEAYKIQVKSLCLGFCGKEQAPYEQFQKEKVFASYAKDIYLVSGCCDLGVTNGAFDANNFRTADLLLKEAAGEAFSEEIYELDVRTDQLLFSITTDDRRRGTAPIA